VASPETSGICPHTVPPLANCSVSQSVPNKTQLPWEQPSPCDILVN